MYIYIINIYTDVYVMDDESLSIHHTTKNKSLKVIIKGYIIYCCFYLVFIFYFSLRCLEVCPCNRQYIYTAQRTTSL